MTSAHTLERELAAALAAVRAASALTRRAQGRLLAGDTLTKSDDSPVTVADFAAQAIVCATLGDSLGTIDVVGEEDPDDLSGDDQAALLEGVVDLVRHQRGERLAASRVLDWIALGSADGTSDRYWTLDPIDGTKGFLRGEQYAVALALVEDGQVAIGVLGCPNLPNGDGSVGAIFAASPGRAVAWTLDNADSTSGSPIRVEHPEELGAARFCESVESGHSDQDQSARIAGLLGIMAEPYRIDSQCKYAAIARGDASIYLRLPTRSDYREKIWDHAAGKFLVEQAGGVVTDVTGTPLDFSHGTRLEVNQGVVATDGRYHGQVIEAVNRVLG